VQVNIHETEELFHLKKNITTRTDGICSGHAEIKPGNRKKALLSMRGEKF